MFEKCDVKSLSCLWYYTSIQHLFLSTWHELNTLWQLWNKTRTFAYSLWKHRTCELKSDCSISKLMSCFDLDDVVAIHIYLGWGILDSAMNQFANPPSSPMSLCMSEFSPIFVLIITIYAFSSNASKTPFIQSPPPGPMHRFIASLSFRGLQDRAIL